MFIGEGAEGVAGANDQVVIGRGAESIVQREFVIGNSDLTHIRAEGTCDLGTTGKPFATLHNSGIVSSGSPGITGNYLAVNTFNIEHTNGVVTSFTKLT